jgi:hypothetical protein
MGRTAAGPNRKESQEASQGVLTARVTEALDKSVVVVIIHVPPTHITSAKTSSMFSSSVSEPGAEPGMTRA